MQGMIRKLIGKGIHAFRDQMLFLSVLIGRNITGSFAKSIHVLPYVSHVFEWNAEVHFPLVPNQLRMYVYAFLHPHSGGL